MKNIAKLLSLVLIVFLLLPVAKLDINEGSGRYEYKVKEYMNYFSVGLGINQTVKTKYDDDSDKERMDMTGSFIGLLAIVAIIGGAVFILMFDTGDDKSTYIIMGIFAAIFLLLLLLPGAVDNIEFDGYEPRNSDMKMTLFYFLSVLSSLGVVGIYAKEKFLKS